MSQDYAVRFVHRIAPRSDDVVWPVRLPDNAFSDRTELARALRSAGVLQSGARLREFRTEGDQVVAFPDRGIWHSLIITNLKGKETET